MCFLDSSFDAFFFSVFIIEQNDRTEMTSE